MVVDRSRSRNDAEAPGADCDRGAIARISATLTSSFKKARQSAQTREGASRTPSCSRGGTPQAVTRRGGVRYPKDLHPRNPSRKRPAKRYDRAEESLSAATPNP